MNEGDRLLSAEETARMRVADEARGEKYIPDGSGNMVNERFQQIMEEKENHFFNQYGRDPDDSDYEGIEDSVNQLYNSGYRPQAPSPEAERALQEQRMQLDKEEFYRQMAKVHPVNEVASRIRIDSEIDEDIEHTKAVLAKQKPYHVEVKASKSKGKPRTWSIKQIYD